MSFHSQVRFMDEHDDRTRDLPPNSRGNYRGNRGQRGNNRNNRGRGGYRGNSRGRGYGNQRGGHRRDAQSAISSKFRGKGDWRSRQRGRNDDRTNMGDDEDIPMRDGGNHYNSRGRATQRYGNKTRNYTEEQRQQWFKVTVPYGNNSEKKFIIESLNDLMDVPFNPVNYHSIGNNSAFFVQDQCVADAIRACSRRITNEKGFKIEFFTSKSSPPMTKLDGPAIEKIKLAMSSRYTTDVKALDLSNFQHDENLNKEGVYPMMGRQATLEIIGNIIDEHIPEVECLLLSQNRLSDLRVLRDIVSKAPNVVKMDLSENNIHSDSELEILKDLKLVELRLDKNPLCRKFKDETLYVAAVRKRCPKLLKLDGNELPALISFAVEDTVDLPESKGSFFITEEAKSVVVAFLEQYFLIYDSDDRQKLMEAYHEQAKFSMSVFSYKSSSVLKQPYLGDYQHNSRNLKIVKDAIRHQKMLHHGRLSIVAQLNQLPRTQHDAATINVDITLATPLMMVFTVTGVFKETSGKNRATRAFSRVFITVPQGSGVVILNEQLTITNPSAELSAKSFKDPPPTPAPSPVMPSAASTVSALSTDIQQAMIRQFSEKSGMNLDFSANCLAQNNWDFERAAKVFTELKSKNQIPPEAFISNSNFSSP